MKRRMFWSILAVVFSSFASDCCSLDLRQCESFGQPCPNGDCNNTVVCKNHETHCYTLWENRTNGVHVIQKGCFIRNTLECRNDHLCLGTPRTTGQRTVFFCCCSDHFCNVNFTIAPEDAWDTYTMKPTSEATTIPILRKTDGSSGDVHKQDNLKALLYSIVPIFGLALILLFSLFIYRHNKRTSSPQEQPIDIPDVEPLLNVLKHPVHRIEVISQGQYGVTVYKAKYSIQTVAVKVFPPQECAEWMNERDIYKVCGLDHENILKFVAEEQHSESQYNGQIYTEYWLITDFHENGSLMNYLKQHPLSLTQLLKFADSISEGLAYLHTEISATSDTVYKPCIAHRDVKSKNILVKTDLTCCIADFGLALQFGDDENLGETHGQVGTKRYMAPEVLEGAISFTRESFLRIDMYACGLVLWELLARTADGPVGDYRLPFEEEVGCHPSLEDMQQVVVQKKMRPQFKDSWRDNMVISSLIQTIEECWDQDGEARLTSHCVSQRLKQAAGYAPLNSLEQVPSVTPVINNTTTPSRESSI